MCCAAALQSAVVQSQDTQMVLQKQARMALLELLDATAVALPSAFHDFHLYPYLFAGSQ